MLTEVEKECWVRVNSNIVRKLREEITSSLKAKDKLKEDFHSRSRSTVCLEIGILFLISVATLFMLMCYRAVVNTKVNVSNRMFYGMEMLVWVFILVSMVIIYFYHKKKYSQVKRDFYCIEREYSRYKKVLSLCNKLSELEELEGLRGVDRFHGKIVEKFDDSGNVYKGVLIFGANIEVVLKSEDEDDSTNRYCFVLDVSNVVSYDLSEHLKYVLNDVYSTEKKVEELMV